MCSLASRGYLDATRRFGCISGRTISVRHSTSVPLTASRLSYLQRKPFVKVTEEDVGYFHRVLSQARVITSEDDVAPYCTDWLKLFRGKGSLVLRPTSTTEVASVLSYCHSRNLAVVPQGGLTGLVGGAVPVFDEIVLSMSLMNKIQKIDPVGGVLVCQAGCVLQTLDQELAKQGMMMPLDLGAKGSCQIGGNVATNAGGIRFLRHGSLHGNVLGLETVLADGTIVDTLSTVRKDNTGYDIKQLFIGSEGTLGVITAVALATPPKPKAVTVCFLACETFPDVLATFHAAKRSLGEVLSACEFMDCASMEMIQRNLRLTNPLGQSYPFYVLIETSGSDEQHDMEKVSRFVESGSGFVNGTMTSDPSKMQAIWGLRERLAEGLLHDGIQHKYDISLPLNVFYDLVEVIRERVKSMAVSCVGYGHLGDGNLHLNITSRERDDDLENTIVPYLYDWTAQHRGSISAEHGLGMMKPQYIGHSKTPAAVQLMRTIKTSMDPKGILNPYKVLPPE